MSHGYELNSVLDLVDEQEAKLARLIGTAAYVRGVRALLEQTALRAWQRGDESRKRRALGSDRPLPKGVRDRQLEPSQKATPLKSPRGIVRDVVVPMRPDPKRRS